MFHSISWPDFIEVIIAIIAAYFGVAALLVCLNRFSSNNSVNPPHPANEKQNPSTMMGPIKPDLEINEHDLTVRSNQLTIVEETKHRTIDFDVHVGPSVLDLLQEIKTLTNQIQDDRGSEAEGLSRYKAIIQKNTHLASGAYKEVINNFLHDQCTNVCGFQIDISEIRLWWPKE